jgi:hypothetical protein
MDVRPITKERCHGLDARSEPTLAADMHRLARDVYLEFSLGSLIRIDLRCDETGALKILEANPKPDLKMPNGHVTSLISEGLAETGMGYDDLILSLLADRVDFLLTHRRQSVRHIIDLLHPEPRHGEERDGALGTAAQRYRQVAAHAVAVVENASAIKAHAVAAAAHSDDASAVAQLGELTADANVKALNAVVPAARRQDEQPACDSARDGSAIPAALSGVS